nr:class I SAM-dependent methyltransferase [Oceanobacter mangrovi]
MYSGVDNTPRFLKRSRMRHAFNMGMTWTDSNAVDGLMAEDAWPLADESLDGVVLQHSLDMCARPHQLVREAARVLQPSGYLVVVGFNPHSVFGAVKLACTLSSQVPWVCNCVDSRRLRDWLTLLDFRVESVTSVAHLWPLRLLTESASRRFDRVFAGRNWLPANAYILVARKTIPGRTPSRQRRWQLPPGFASNPAIARVKQQD